MGKGSNMLLVHGAGVSAERSVVLPEEHSYPGDFCTCSNVELVPALLPAGSSLLRGKKCQAAVEGSPACLPPRRSPDKEEIFNYTSERSGKTPQ